MSKNGISSKHQVQCAHDVVFHSECAFQYASAICDTGNAVHDLQHFRKGHMSFTSSEKQLPGLQNLKTNKQIPRPGVPSQWLPAMLQVLMQWRRQSGATWRAGPGSCCEAAAAAGQAGQFECAASSVLQTPMPTLHQCLYISRG